MKLTIKKLTPCPSLLLRSTIARIDHLDAYSCFFQTTNLVTPKSITLAFFACRGAALALMEIRDFVLKPFGIKTNTTHHVAETMESEIEVGRGSGLFKILAVTPKEIILGENDTHLDFRVSLLLEKNVAENGFLLRLSTAVKLNNRAGSLYLLFIGPFHRMIVRSMIKKIVRYVTQP